jgi:hypothetical protein
MRAEDLDQRHRLRGAGRSGMRRGREMGKHMGAAPSHCAVFMRSRTVVQEGQPFDVVSEIGRPIFTFARTIPMVR